MKRIFFIIATFLISSYVQANHTLCRTSRSFLFPRPIYHNIAAIENLWNIVIHGKPFPHFMAMEAIGLYQKSKNNQNLASYFLLDCKNTISIKGDSTPGAHRRDVRAEWLNLPSDFSGCLTLNPEQEQAAVLLKSNFDIAGWFNCQQVQHVWIDFSAPIVWVRNSLRPTQIIENPGTPAPGQPATIIEAFNQKAWSFGKIRRCAKNKVALAQLRMDIGTTLLQCDQFRVFAYVGLTIPTAKKQKATYLFNPFVGINGHLGVNGGFRFETLILPECPKLTDATLSLFFHIESCYFFHNSQCRTLDIKRPIDRGCVCPTAINDCTPPYDPHHDIPLPDILDIDLSCKDKQWSRYLMLREPGKIQTVPGVNVLTQRVRVYPYTTVDLSTGFVFNYGILQAEIGYNLWARSKEQLELIEPHCETALFNFQHFGIAGREPGTSASMSTIRLQAPDDPNFVTIEQRDISLASGAFAGGSTHRAHVSIAYVGDPCASHCFASAGFYYEVPNRNRNTVFQNWGTWATLGAVF